MERYFLELAFDGTRYHGWQVQENAVTVQSIVDDGLRKICGDPGIQTVGCGRTDTGVHASQFFVHYESDQPQENMVHRLNRFFPDDIICIRHGNIDSQWHARFDALARTYQYFIRFNRSPFKTQYCWTFHHELNVDAMNQASQFLLGEQDFSAFSKSHTQTKTNICNVKLAHWIKNQDELVFEVRANRFLRNMVRAIVGTMVEVGRGKLRPEDVKQIIESKNRSEAGPSVPAKGLFLSKIEYPEI